MRKGGRIQKALCFLLFVWLLCVSLSTSSVDLIFMRSKKLGDRKAVVGGGKTVFLLIWTGIARSQKLINPISLGLRSMALLAKMEHVWIDWIWCSS